MHKISKTTAMGVACIIVAILVPVLAQLDHDPETKPNWDPVAAQVAAGLGLIYASDQIRKDGNDDEGS